MRMKRVFCLLAACAMLSSAGFAQGDNTLTAGEKKNGWVLLFDGAGTAGWTTPGGKPVPGGWEVKEGSLTAKNGGKGGDIITVTEYAGFELGLDYNIAPGCNSGVKYFYTKYEKGGNLGIEFQILDDALTEDNKPENHRTGSFYDVMPTAVPVKANAPGKWNTIRIVVRGKEVEHWLNGKKILTYTRGSQAYQEGVAKSKFSKTTPAFGMVEKGHILLQEHGGQVSFRNIKIRPLK